MYLKIYGLDADAAYNCLLNADACSEARREHDQANYYYVIVNGRRRMVREKCARIAMRDFKTRLMQRDHLKPLPVSDTIRSFVIANIVISRGKSTTAEVRHYFRWRADQPYLVFDWRDERSRKEGWPVLRPDIAAWLYAAALRRTKIAVEPTEALVGALIMRYDQHGKAGPVYFRHDCSAHAKRRPEMLMSGNAQKFFEYALDDLRRIHRELLSLVSGTSSLAGYYDEGRVMESPFDAARNAFFASSAFGRLLASYSHTV